VSQAFQTIIEGGIAELVINKPPVNALDSSEWYALAHRIDELGHDPSVRVMVIRAVGRGFRSGGTG
jgi:enoyl-CoA hydratase